MYRYCAFALLSLALALAGGSTSFAAAPPGAGKSAAAPGQARAAANCSATVGRQVAKGVAAGGGKKAGIPGPANCDHSFNP